MSRLSLGGGQEVFITVRVAESDYFRREGQDVHTTAYISLSQALLGGVIRITGLHGDLNLRIPQVTQSSSMLLPTLMPLLMSGNQQPHRDDPQRAGNQAY